MKEPPGTYAHKQTCALIGQTRQSGDDQMIKCWDQIQHSGPDSVMVRAFASEAGGAGSNPGRVIPKTLKMVPVATLLGAQH